MANFIETNASINEILSLLKSYRNENKSKDSQVEDGSQCGTNCDSFSTEDHPFDLRLHSSL